MRPRTVRQSLLGRMRRTGVAKWLTLVALVLAGGSQLEASWHEVAVRHVRCADHGELTHVKVATLASAENKYVPSPLASAGAQETETADAHEHCAVALIAQGGVQAPRAPAPTRFSPPAAVTHRAPTAAPCPGRSVVLASAPKTSPPRA